MQPAEVRGQVSGRCALPTPTLLPQVAQRVSLPLGSNADTKAILRSRSSIPRSAWSA